MAYHVEWIAYPFPPSFAVNPRTRAVTNERNGVAFYISMPRSVIDVFIQGRESFTLEFWKIKQTTHGKNRAL